MYVIIVGGGKVGATLSESLLDLGHEVLVIERSEDRCEVLREELGSVVMCGDGCEAALLSDAGAERADLLIAVTEGDEDNLVACQVARHRFHVGRAIARINDPKNEKLFHLLGVQATVDAVGALANGVLHLVPGRYVTHLATFREGELVMTGIKIPERAACVGKPVMETDLPEGAIVTAVIPKHGRPHPTTSEVVLAVDDEVVVLIRPEDATAAASALTQ